MLAPAMVEKLHSVWQDASYALRQMRRAPSFAAAQRTREIGVRIALGAKPSHVLRLFMRRGMLLTGTGLVIGIVTALASGRLVTGLLYGVTPTDPFTLLAVALFLTAVAMLATYLPARRATRVDPMVTLRAE